MGADRWPRSWNLLEIFCGRGSGLRALRRMGFENLRGLDLSPELLALHPSRRGLAACDCRWMPIASSSQDVVIVQGGLHHLEAIPADLDVVLAECSRVSKPDGIVCIVEPWMTPFLALAHLACRQRLARRSWPRLDALATMIEHEIVTYEQWLAHPKVILESIHRRFSPEKQTISRGKLRFVGRNRS